MAPRNAKVWLPADVGGGAEPKTARRVFPAGGRFAAMVARRQWPSDITRAAALPILTALLTAAIFVVDTVTPYEISAATFYVIVVLLSLRFCTTQGVIRVSAICVVLTVVSFVLTPDGNFETGIVNTSISLLAIAATTYLAVRIESSRVMAEQAQAHLAHVARVTTLGELAASIAHEVNQPLAAIVANANACVRWMNARPSNIERATASIESIVEDANRASAIVGRVRALATRTAPRKDWVEINGLILDVLALMRMRFRESRITLRTDLPSDLPMIFGDRVQLQQVVLNLLVNAIDAIKAGPGDSRELHIASSKSGARALTVTVEDTGIGIDPVSASHLFEAFYSTKSEGMGIGLSICRSIVEAHGGRIWVEPNKPRGAILSFTLPTDREKTW